MSIYTPQQADNIRRAIHPDCCLSEVCTFCGASEVNLKACNGDLTPLALKLFEAAYRHDHNHDPSRVLHPSASTNDATLLDEAARFVADEHLKLFDAALAPTGLTFSEAVGLGIL